MAHANHQTHPHAQARHTTRHPDGAAGGRATSLLPTRTSNTNATPSAAAADFLRQYKPVRDKDSPCYNLPGAAAPVHSGGHGKTAVKCISRDNARFTLIVPTVPTHSRGTQKHKWQWWLLLPSTSHHMSLPCLGPIARPIQACQVADRGQMRPPECTSATRERADQTVPQ